MPRIFIAIQFSHEVKTTLLSLQDALRSKGVKGNYCPYGNLHMTLAFIGESYDLPAIRKAVGEVASPPFTMTLSCLGSFPTKTGVIWCGVNEKESVTALARQLRSRLAAHGIPFASTPFYPHISLLRHPTSLRITDIKVPATPITVERISVMKSERIEGELVYSLVDSHPL